MKTLLMLATALALIPSQMAAAGDGAAAEHLQAEQAIALVVDPAPDGAAVTRALVRSLWSRSDARQAQALQDLIYHAAVCTPGVDLQAAVMPLLVIATESPLPEHRIMAVQALSRIGDAQSLLKLARATSFETSPRVQRIILLAVSEVSKQQA
jgi:hypothetical protein